MKCLFALRTFTNKTHENGNNTDCKNNKSERGIYLLKKEFKIILFTNLLNFKTEITTAINHNSPQLQHKNHPDIHTQPVTPIPNASSSELCFLVELIPFIIPFSQDGRPRS